MKNQTFISFIAFLLLVSISFIGCDNDGGGGSSQDTQALTENDFANDPSLRADPEGGVIVQFLEHPDSDTSDNDTGETGNDTIPFRYTRTLENTFCWEDDDPDAEHFMVLEDREGNEILTLDVGDCVTEVILEGDYVMIINHDGRIERTFPIFIIPDQNGDLGAKKEETIAEGIVGRAGRVLSDILQNLHNTITQNVKAQPVERNVRTLLRTNACVDCNLVGADLTGANLTGANVTGANLTAANLTDANLTAANLTDANLTAANLTEADLCGANLTEADLLGADLTGANLTDANLTDANLTAANLTEADLCGAFLLNANLLGADLTGANLTEALLTGASLTAATWCDGSTCLEGSIGTCETGFHLIDNCDGTISDADTGLVWEKKDSPGGGNSFCPGGPTCDNPHDVNNLYNWSTTGSAANGSAFTDFLEKLNNGCNNDPTVDCSAGGAADCVTAGVGGACGFAAHRDWRLPEVGQDGGTAELETILDLSEGNCGGGSGACIDPIFGPTAASFYWSATTLAIGPNVAWVVDFGNSDVNFRDKGSDRHVRAVRP